MNFVRFVERFYTVSSCHTSISHFHTGAIMLLPLLGDNHLHKTTQGAATLYLGLCAFALTAR